MKKISCLLAIFAVFSVLHCNAENQKTFSEQLFNKLGAPGVLLTTRELQIVSELVSGDSISSVTEAFSIGRDSLAITTGGQAFLLYWDFLVGQKYTVKAVNDISRNEDICVTEAITPSSQNSAIGPGQLFVKPSVLLGFNGLTIPQVIDLNYVGVGKARNLDVNIFRTQFDIDDIAASATVTYYVLNETFYPGSVVNNQPPIIQIDAFVGLKSGVKTETYTYNIFSFNASPQRRILRQALETPKGVYCQGRVAGFRLPENLPDSSSGNSEGYVPDPYGLIISGRGSYDTEFELVFNEYRIPAFNDSRNVQHISILHDFFDGLSYTYDFQTRECAVQEISLNSTDSSIVDGQPNLIQIASPRHFFQFDDVEYQYAGQKPCRDRFTCNVWIGEKALPNNKFERREWYWAVSINDEPLNRYFPVQYNIKTYTGTQYTGSYNVVLFNYRSRSLQALFAADLSLAECYRALGPSNKFNLATLTFRLNNDAQLPVMRNLNVLRFHLAETLLFTMLIRPIRLSALSVDKEDNDIVVTFTLIGSPPNRGPVQSFYNESSLDDTITRLKDAIDSGNFATRGRAHDRQVILRARPKSLKINSHSSTYTPDTKTIESGPRITAFWIVFVVIGLVVGIIVGLLVLKKMTSN